MDERMYGITGSMDEWMVNGSIVVVHGWING